LQNHNKSFIVLSYISFSPQLGTTHESQHMWKSRISFSLHLLLPKSLIFLTKGVLSCNFSSANSTKSTLKQPTYIWFNILISSADIELRQVKGVALWRWHPSHKLNGLRPKPKATSQKARGMNYKPWLPHCGVHEIDSVNCCFHYHHWRDGHPSIHPLIHRSNMPITILEPHVVP
jgi:hypothetical protein